MIKKVLWRSIPWLITVAALYYAFYGVRWDILLSHVSEAKAIYVVWAVVLTALSYVLRAVRWRGLFPERNVNFGAASRVLFLGFFMNNILPARAGEFVRAHMGARLTGCSRALVLATIASERLIDGLTISLMFVVFALGVGDAQMSHNLLLVAAFFGIAALLVFAALLARRQVFTLADSLNAHFNNRYSHYVLERLKIFINGLSPLFALSHLPALIFLSLAVWFVELGVYKMVGAAFSADLSTAGSVLFLVAVNFASLIPSAPAGVGVIEAIASLALVSLGVPKEQALTMVISQHAIQYLVVGIPGAIVMFNWKNILAQIRREETALAEPQNAP